MASTSGGDGVFTVKNNAQSQNISVYARVRPAPSLGTADWKFADTSVSSARANSTKEYHLDGVFHQASTQQVYDRSTKHLIQPVLDGFSCTIFAYGQTASGKTHTMRGTTAEPGIVVHAVKDLFEGVIKSAREQKREFCIRASYLEIYNEEVNDLLDTGKRNLTIKADSEKGIMVAGLSESLVYNIEDVMRVFQKGDMNRRVGETKMNEASSRSHSIFRVVVESTSIEEAEKALQESSGGGELDAAVTIGELNLVDLAGSERANKTGAEGSRLKEGANINKSLLTLGLVIKNLSDSASQGGRHIPYRDSKLTRILQPSLGGSGRTAIICAISMEQVHAEESHNTLEFATRAKRVVNTVSATETMTSAALLKRQAKEIDKLKDQLRDRGENIMADGIKELQQRMLDMEKELEMKEAMNKQVTKEKEFYERQNTMLAHAAARTGKRGRRRDTFHFDHRSLGPASPESPVYSGVSGEGGSLMHGHMGGIMEAVQEEDDVDGATALTCGDLDGDSGTLVKKARRHGSMASDVVMATETEPEGGNNTGPSATPSVEEPFAQELRAQMRQLKAQKAETEAALAQQAEDAHAREQELLDEVANARDATSHAEQQTASLDQRRDALEEDLKRTKLNLAELECKQRRGNSELAQTEEKTAGLQQQIENMSAEKESLAQQMEEQRSQIQQLQDEVKELATRAQEELVEKERQLYDAHHATDKVNVDRSLLQEREQNRQAEVEKHRAALKALRDELEAERLKAEAADASRKSADEELEDANEEIERLRKHVVDLESRKRPPLYQRKQEEELQATKDHASECEQRATAAEATLKDVQHELHTAQNDAEDSKQELQSAQSHHQEVLKDVRVRADFDLQEARTSANKLKQELDQRLQEAQHNLAQQLEAVSALQGQLADAGTAAEISKAQSDSSIAAKQAQLTQAQDTIREYEEAMVASSYRTQELEDQLTAQERTVTELSAKLEETGKTLEDTKATAATTATETAAAHVAAVEELKKSHAAGMEEMVNKALDIEAEAEKEAEAKMKETQEREAALAAEHHHALEIKAAELEASMEEKAKFQTLVDDSAAAHKAHTELKELRIRSKQEISQLAMQLKAANMSSKGGDKAQQGMKKDIEKVQKRLADTETKLRNTSDEKLQLTTEKAVLERKAKVTEAQVSKLTKELEKKDGVCSRKITGVQEDLSKVQKQKAVLESSLQHMQQKHEAHVQEATTKADTAATALTEAQRLNNEYAARLEECQQQFMELEGESDTQMDQLQQARADLAARSEELAAMTNAMESLAVQLTATEATLEEQARSHQTLEDDLAQCQEDLQRSIDAYKALEAEVAKVQPLSTEVAALRATLAERDSAMNEAAVAIETAQLQADEAADREASARDEGARHVAHVAALQQQLAEVEAARQAALRDFAAAADEATKLRGESKELALCREHLQKATEEVEELFTKNEELEAAVEQLVPKLAEADERDKAAAARHEEAHQERETLVSKHVAAIAEKNQRLDDLSAALRSAKVGQEDALTEKSNLEERLRAAEADKQHLASDMEAAKTEAQNSQIEAEAVQMELQDLLDFQKTVSVAQDHHQVRHLQTQVASLEESERALREKASVELAAVQDRAAAALALAGGLEKERDSLKEQLQAHSGGPATSQEVAQLHAQLAEMEAQRQERAGELQALEAQLQDKVHWHGRFQKRLDQYDLVLKQSRREQWDRKKYKDTLLNMSIEIERRNLMEQKTFKQLQSQLEKRWEDEAHRRHEEKNRQTAAQQQQQGAQPAPAPAVASVPPARSRASLPPRAPAITSSKDADVGGSQSAGKVLAEVSGQPRRALGELPVQQ